MSSENEKLRNAISEVKSGEKSYRKAAQSNGVLLSKLYRHATNKNQSETRGRQPLLNPLENEILTKYVVYCLERGTPRRPKDIIDAAHSLLRKRTGEKTKKPGKTWLRSFLAQNNLSLRKPEKITHSAASLAKEDILFWYENVYKVLQKENEHHLLSIPSRVFNADETFVPTNPLRGNVVAPTGTKNVLELTPGNDKEGVTAMCGYSADGQPLKPFLIYAYDRIPKSLRESFPHDRAVLQSSKNGWMDSERCVLYLEHVAREVKERGIDLPRERILLFWDRHPSHMTLDVCQAADKLGITLIGLYPNSTFLTQPCDVAIFRSLKSHWDEVTRQAKFNDVNKNITKLEFPHLFLEAFDRVTVETIQSGFRATGIFPWNPEAVDYSKCLGRKATETADGEVNDQNLESEVRCTSR
jgi:DDE superfamily endonuclease/Tc5 transposase DNA-binding domain